MNQYNMRWRWMNDLPMELHQYIHGYLPKEKLLEMLRMSKYYRLVAEEFLYKEIYFHEEHYFQINLLFLTILDRPDLAKGIKRFTLIHETSSRAVKHGNNDYYRDSFNKITTVRDMIDDIGRDLNWELVMRWFGDIYACRESFDGALAVILCLAQNLEHLDLGIRTDRTLSITTKLLEQEWRHSRKSPEICPFGKLKSLCIGGGAYSATPVFPWMESLSIKYNYRSHRQGVMYFPYRGSSTKLRILEMQNVDASPTDFEKLLSYPELSNLKELKVSGLYVEPESEWKDYDLQHLTQAIEKHLPDLEILHWFKIDWDPDWLSPRTFGSFKGLSKLSELKLDAHLLATQDLIYNQRAETLALTRPEEYLPDSLKALHIVSLSAQDERVDAILEVARTLKLQTVELSLSLEDWDPGYEYRPAGVRELRKSRRKFFRESVANLTALGTTMRVWRQEGRFPKEVLFAPGYQRPWPIWNDIESLHWSRHVRDAWEVKQGIRTPGSDDALGDSSEEGDSDVDEEGNIAGQSGIKKKGDDEEQGDGYDKSRNKDGNMAAEKASGGDAGRSVSGAAGN
ncbi:uncharacterized protein J4E79_004924 [Alternaria viburni]|uniref:uncharacterized protein n=1 Tax=Alternaria viburni TaxID=566460 RepID=UPI0020C3B2AD|nr:uncharacterized protein J4E79_004924 [Alternaria viburni]KAI4661114.1 hypothetical protein J4E79_004924 [Alternaria viburni]